MKMLTRMMTTKRRLGWTVFAVLALLTLLIYWPTFFGQWTHDDFPVIVENSDVQSWTGFLEDSYPGRPLRELTYLLDVALFGLNPAGFAVQNLLWHAVNAALLWVLIARLGGSRFLSTTAAAIFVSHPLMVEVVANSSHRKDSLALCFSLLSLLAFSKIFSHTGNLWRWLPVACIFMLISTQAKQTGWLVPLLWAFYWRAFVARDDGGALRLWRCGAVLFWGGSISAICFVWFFWKEKLFQIATSLYASMGGALSTDEMLVYYQPVLKGWAFMAKRVAYPWDLGIEYVFTLPDSWKDPWVVAGFLLGSTAIALLVVLPERAPMAYLGVALVVVFWLPVSNLWPLSYFAADRYLYGPMAGFSLLTSVGLEQIYRRYFQFALAAVALLVVVLFSVLSYRQARVWDSPLSLWTQSSAVSPASTKAWNNLGSIYLEADRCEDAIPYLQKAANRFNNSMPFLNLARCQEKLGERKEAEKNFRAFLSFKDHERKALSLQVRWHLQQYYNPAAK